jgi:hypothetical protein
MGAALGEARELTRIRAFGPAGAWARATWGAAWQPVRTRSQRAGDGTGSKCGSESESTSGGRQSAKNAGGEPLRTREFSGRRGRAGRQAGAQEAQQATASSSCPTALERAAATAAARDAPSHSLAPSRARTRTCPRTPFRRMHGAHTHAARRSLHHNSPSPSLALVLARAQHSTQRPRSPQFQLLTGPVARRSCGCG